MEATDALLWMVTWRWSDRQKTITMMMTSIKIWMMKDSVCKTRGTTRMMTTTKTLDFRNVCFQIPWDNNHDALAKWANATTGFPWIDAIMTQLREEVKSHRWNHRWNNRWNHYPTEGGIYPNYSILQGWIHHLARHAVACFLTRGDLWVSWEEGLKVFDELLLDADWWEFHSTQFCRESRALELPSWNITHAFGCSGFGVHVPNRAKLSNLTGTSKNNHSMFRSVNTGTWLWFSCSSL